MTSAFVEAVLKVIAQAYSYIAALIKGLPPIN